MIISQAPFRVSFVGGGTDFEDYYKQSFGNVVSTTINKAIFVSINKKFNGKLFLRYGETELELVNHVDELKHDMVKAVLKMFNIESGIEIAIMSDIPAKGSGLGSSSALASALIQAIGKYQGQDIYKNDLAKKVSELEIDIMKKSIGYQDQYEICNGGFNKIYFDAGNILVSPINGKYSEIVHWIEKLSMLFYLGNGRNAENILDEHVKNIPDKKQVLDKQRYLVAQLIAWLNDKKQDRKIGELISECWILISNLPYMLALAVLNYVVLVLVDLCL